MHPTKNHPQLVIRAIKMNKYKIRHETLGLLCDLHYKVLYDTKETENRNEYKSNLVDIPLNVFLEKLNISEADFRKANVSLSYNEEIKYLPKDEGTELIALKRNGVIAYESRKYLKEKIEERNEKYYGVTKWLLPSIAIIISIVALLYTCNKKSVNGINIYIHSKDTVTTKTVKIDSSIISN